jgi:hypothetical protein
LGRAEATQERLVAAAATDDEPLPAAMPIVAAN